MPVTKVSTVGGSKTNVLTMCIDVSEINKKTQKLALFIMLPSNFYCGSCNLQKLVKGSTYMPRWTLKCKYKLKNDELFAFGNTEVLATCNLGHVHMKNRSK